MDKPKLPFLTATELGRLIKTKEVSPVEATEAYLDRIDKVDYKFNSYLTVCHVEALKKARQAEQAILKGNYLGPVHGIPIAVKDQILTKGIRTTLGSPIINAYVPNEDATVIEKLKTSGAILLRKLNMAEFGSTAFSHRFGTVRNIWNLEMYTGGSSSG